METVFKYGDGKRGYIIKRDEDVIITQTWYASGVGCIKMEVINKLNTSVQDGQALLMGYMKLVEESMAKYKEMTINRADIQRGNEEWLDKYFTSEG